MTDVIDSLSAALKDSGERTNFPTGSVRDRKDGKGRYDLLPMDALHELAKHFEKGAVKYGDRNWEIGQPLSNYIDSGLRHLCQFAAGMRDEPHAVSAAWNILAMIQTAIWIERGVLPRSLNDLPCRPPLNDRDRTPAGRYAGSGRADSVVEAVSTNGPAQVSSHDTPPREGVRIEDGLYAYAGDVRKGHYPKLYVTQGEVSMIVHDNGPNVFPSNDFVTEFPSLVRSGEIILVERFVREPDTEIR
jgi:hypothetical protein